MRARRLDTRVVRVCREVCGSFPLFALEDGWGGAVEGRGGTSDGSVMEYDLESTEDDLDSASGGAVFVAVGD